MEPFIQSDQYQMIREQAQILVNGHAGAKDQNVLRALQGVTLEKVLARYEDLSSEQKALLECILDVEDGDGMERFVQTIKPFVVPFPEVSEQKIKKLFPKVKKMSTPKLNELDMQELSYIGWNDAGSNRKYMIIQEGDSLKGVYGSFEHSHKKGICAICHKHATLGMFLLETKKGGNEGTYTKRGNYICTDSDQCNQQLTDVARLEEFIETVTKS